MLGHIGKTVAPALDPLGFSWKMDIGLLTGVVAKELVVSSLGVMYAGDEAVAVAAAAGRRGVHDLRVAVLPLHRHLRGHKERNREVELGCGNLRLHHGCRLDRRLHRLPPHRAADLTLP